MKWWSLRPVFCLMIGVFLALGLSLSAAQAADMAVKMATAAHMGAPGGCDGCDGGDEGAAMTGPCLPMCTGTGLAVLPAGLTVNSMGVSQALIPGSRVLHERAPSPDPYPPRPIDLG